LAYDPIINDKSLPNDDGGQVKISNRFNLPDTILRAVAATDERYSRGPVDRSVTQLIRPPRIQLLQRKHWDDIEKDVSDEVWALLGSALHQILELGKTKDMVVEERLYAHVDGWDLSGMADVQTINPDGTISLADYKMTSSYVLLKDEGAASAEWTAQLNMLAYLVQFNKKVRVRDLTVVCFVRDWQRKMAQVDPAYPAAQVVSVPIPLWSLTEQLDFITERIRQHRHAEMMMDLGLPLEECTAEERWSKPDSWAVIKDGAKRASRVHDDKETAEIDVAARGKGYRVEFRPGKSTRCQGNYCSVAPYCEQWEKIRSERNEA
jgi:hypothetical protein